MRVRGLPNVAKPVRSSRLNTTATTGPLIKHVGMRKALRRSSLRPESLDKEPLDQRRRRCMEASKPAIAAARPLYTITTPSQRRSLLSRTSHHPSRPSRVPTLHAKPPKHTWLTTTDLPLPAISRQSETPEPPKI